MITVACVNVQDYLGMGSRYVEKLCWSVTRNLRAEHKFVCITESNKPGWFAKCDLFQPGRFTGRVLYLDLDTVIVGTLDELVKHKGILHLADWGWKKNDYGSGVMCWDAGEHEEIFTRYEDTVPTRFLGDQDYMTSLGGWDALPKGLNVSYRYHCKKGPPEGAATVSFHGHPKPHEFQPRHWVSEAWH